MPTSNPSSSSFSTYRISSSLNNNSNNETSRIPLFWLNFISGGQVHDGRQNILSADTVYTMDDTNPRLFPLNRLAGTIGAAITCPLEVVKTRLQVKHGREEEVEKGLKFTK